MSSNNGYERIIKFIKANPALIKIIGSEKIAAEIDALVNSPGAEPVDKTEYAEFLICSGLYEKAAEALHAIIDSDSANYRAHYLLARCYYMNGSLKEAQYPIIKCLEIQPNYDEGRLLLARIFLKARQYEKAQKLFEFYQNHPRYGVIARLYIAKGYYYSGGFESAAAYLEALLKSGEKSPLFPAIYAYQLSNVEKYDRAFSLIYAHSLNAENENAPQRYILDFMTAFLFSFAARSNYLEQYLDEAFEILKKYGDDVSRMNDPVYDLYRNFAMAAYYMKKRDYEKMQQYAEKVSGAGSSYEAEDFAVFDFEEFNNIYSLARQNKNKSEALKMKSAGCLHINSGNLSSAVLCFEKASSYAPEDVEILSMLGESYVLTAQTARALNAYSAIKKLAPANIDAYRRTSEIYMGLGHYDKFISECRQILALDPADIISRYFIGEYLFNNSNLKEAEEFLKHIAVRIESELKTSRLESLALETRDIYEKTCFILAQIAYRDGNKENTIIYLNSVINVNPENEKAFELLNKLKQSRQDKQIMFLLREADEKEAQQDYTTAMHLYENVIEIEPQFIDAHFRLAKNLIRQKNFDRALFELERIFDYNYKSYDKTAEVYLAMALISYEISKIDKCRESLYSLSHISSDASIALMLLYLHKTSFLIFGSSPDFNNLLDELMLKKHDAPDDFINNFSLGYIINNIPGWLFEDQAIFAESLKSAKMAFESDTDDIYAAYSYAFALEKAGENEQAFEIYSRIASLDHNAGPEVNHTKEKYSLLNNYQNYSISFYNFNLLQNLNLVNFIGGAVNKVAYYEESRGNFEDAAHYYLKASKLDKDNPAAAMKTIDLQLNAALSDKNLKISRVSAMIKNLKKEAAADSSRAELKFQLGYLYFKLPDDLDVLGSTLENVVMELKHCVAIDNKYIPAYAVLRAVFQKMGAKDKKMYALALETVKKAADFIDNKNPYLNIELGDCYYYYYAQDFKNDALEYYKKAVLHKPDFTEAHFKMASIYRIKKDFEKAILHYGITYDLEPNGAYAQECKKSIATLKRRHMIE